MKRHLHSMSRKGWLAASAFALTGTLAVVLPLQPLSSVGAAERGEATLYEITQEGLTPDSAAQLADRAGIGNALQPDGSFGFVDETRFATMPLSPVGRGEDERGRPTTAEALDLEALAKYSVLPDRRALQQASKLMQLPDGYKGQPVIGNTTLDRSDDKGRLIDSTKLDTTVSFKLNLDGLPVIGPGAKARVSFAGDGSVVQLTQSIRAVQPSGKVGIIGPNEAQKACSALYGPETGQAAPILGYYAGPLAATDASGVVA